MAITTYTSGSCTVTYNDNNHDLHITVSGNGPMADYDSTTCRNNPWYGKTFDSLTIEEGVTSVGDYAFYTCKCSENQITGEDQVSLPSTLKRIGKYAFYGM